MLLVRSFEHHIFETSSFYIKVGTDIINTKKFIPYSIIDIFKDTQKKVEVCNILRVSVEVCNILIGSSVVVEWHHSVKVVEW